MSDEKRLLGSEVNRMFGKSSSWVYSRFEDQQEDGATISAQGMLITQHAAQEGEGIHSTQWVYTVEDVAGTDNQPVEPKVKPSKAPKDDVSDRRLFWESLITIAKNAETRLEMARRQAADDDIFRDNELWEVVTEDRRQALKTLEGAIPEIGKSTLANKDHLHWLSSEEVDMLRVIRSAGLSLEDFRNPPDETETQEEEEKELEPNLKPKPQKKPEKKPDVEITTRKAVIYGGDPRSDTVKSVKDSMGFDVVEWVRSKKNRRMEAAVNRVANGKYDVVFVLLRFAGHGHAKQLMEACKESNTTYVPVKHGYGVTALRRALEHAEGENLSAHGSRGDANVEARK